MNTFLLPWQPPQLCLSRAVSCRLPPLSSFAFPFLLSASPLTSVGTALEEKGQGHQRLCMRTRSSAHTHNKWIQGQGGKPINHSSITGVMAIGVYWRNPVTNGHSDPSKLFAFSLTRSNVKKLKGFTARSQELTIPQKKRR